MVEHVVVGCQCEGKTCTECLVVRCYSEFSKDKRLKSGLKARCKICCRAICKAWHQSHVEHDANYRQVNRDRHREKGRAHYHENKEKYREYRLTHAESIREYKRSWEKKNQERLKVLLEIRHEKIKEQRRTRYRNNPDKAIERSRNYKLAHPEYNKNYGQTYPEIIRRKTAHRRARRKNASGTYTLRQWLELKEQYGHMCLCCGRKEPEIKLTVDHVVPLTKGGDNTINNIQPLCFSCNSTKRTKIIDYRTKKETSYEFQPE